MARDVYVNMVRADSDKQNKQDKQEESIPMVLGAGKIGEIILNES